MYEMPEEHARYVPRVGEVVVDTRETAPGAAGEVLEVVGDELTLVTPQASTLGYGRLWKATTADVIPYPAEE